MARDIYSKVAARIKSLSNPHNAIWYVFVFILLAITWSGIKAVQTNYGLQKQISQLKQENAVLKLQNENIALNNQYLQSDQFLSLAARQDLGLAAPGETVLLIPSDVAMKYVDKSITPGSVTTTTTQTAKSQSRLMNNLEAWRDFLLGRTILSD